MSSRVPWGDFPPVLRNGLTPLVREPEYEAAKAGNREAAFEMAYRLITVELIEEAHRLIGDDPDARILPIHAEEATGRNKIPLAFAEVLAHHLDLQVEYEIYQATRVQRTGASADHRLAFCPSFKGAVEPGRAYLVVDDTLTMGGSIAELRGHILSNGGRVAGAAVMAARESGVDIAIKPKMLNAIKAKHGEELDNYWRQEFGHGIESLTQGEAGHLKAAASFDSIRSRIAAARDAHGRSMDEGKAISATQKAPQLTLVGLSDFRAGQVSRAEGFFRKAEEAFWMTGEDLPRLKQDIENRALVQGDSPDQALRTFRDDPRYQDLALAVSGVVDRSGLAQANEKRLLLTQRRLDRQIESAMGSPGPDGAEPDELDYI